MMKRKIYFIQPTYRDQTGKILKGKKLYTLSLALPALSATVPDTWEKEFCFEYFEPVNFNSTASVIGISCMGYDIFRGIEIAREFRRRGKTVIFGGCQPHISTNYVAKFADAIVHGNPGPSDMTAILSDHEHRRLEKEYFCKLNLNYRFDYSIIDTGKIFFTPVLLSMGCNHSCEFCSTAAMYQGRYQLRNFRNVIDELTCLNQKTRNIAFLDTNIYNNRKYLIKVCREIVQRQLKFTWGAQCTIDVGDDPETLSLMKQTGCKILFIGMETINQANLDDLKKTFSYENYQRQIKTIHQYGIRIAGFFMYGLDHDTTSTAEQISEYISRNRIALPMLNVLVPTPGTKIYQRLKEEGRILMKDEEDFLKNNVTYNSSFNLCFYVPKNMSTSQVEEGFYHLLKSLSGYWRIFHRSVSRNIPLTVYLLYMNWLFRKEYLQMKKYRREKLSP